MSIKLSINILTLLLTLFSAQAQAQNMPKLYSSVNQEKMLRWVDSVYNRMSEDERIGQFFMVIAEPSTNASNINSLVNLINNQKIGGVLFQKGDPESQVIMTNHIQREARIPLLIALDGEWGLSMRLSNTTRFPKNMMIGALTDNFLIEQYGEEVGRQCREMGIHINFAPTVDVNSNPKNPVIGIRSFGEDPEDVARKAIAYSRGLEKAGIIAVAKHFPGHGDTDSDSHHTLPTVSHNLKRLNELELYPFNRFIKSGFSGIMTAHLNVPALGTKGRPGSFSYEVVTELLRDRMGFRGLCFTDGLAMQGAVVEKNESIAVLALKAGNDILVGPVNTIREVEAVKQAVKRKELDMDDLNRRCRRILCYKYIAGLHQFKPLPTSGLDQKLNTPEAEWINSKLNAEAITVVKNDGDILPFKQLGVKRIAAVSIGSNVNNEFQTMLKRYNTVTCFSIASNASDADRKRVFDKLKDFDVILCSVHATQAREFRELQTLASAKELIYVFFTTPYQCANFRQSCTNAKSIVVAYEPTSFAQKFAAQVVFGGIAAKGVLSVSIPNMYPAGTGIRTEKTRLGFHEPEEVNINPYKLLTIDNIIYEGLKQQAYPGCQVVVAKNGMIVYNKSFGHYDFSKKNEVTENTVYDLASITKATGTLLAVMKSYDEGNFTMTNKISDFVPELKFSDKNDLVIRDLLYHQSGLPATINFYEKAIDNKSYTGSLYSGRKDNNHTVRFDSRTYVNNSFRFKPDMVSGSKKTGFDIEVANNFFVSNTFADSIISGIIDARMGTKGRYVYSCINFILLKKMVEKQLGQPIDRLLDTYYFQRLGTTTTTYNPLQKMDVTRIAPSENDQFLRHQVVRGYVHDEAAAFQGGVSGNAGLFSSAIDLAKIAQLYLNDGTYGDERFISSRTCKLFTGSKSPTSRRGLGFDKPDANNPSSSPCGLHTPQSAYGHTGFTGTCFWIDPDNDLIFVFLSNRTYPSRSNTQLFTLDIRTRIQDAIYEAIIE